MKGGRSRAIEQVSVGMERKGGWDESYIVEFTWIGNRFQKRVDFERYAKLGKSSRIPPG